MPPIEEKSLSEIRQNVMQLRYQLARYKMDGIFPPMKFLVELKMAECLLKLELTDTIRINVKA
jgi:hypothetical protein